MKDFMLQLSQESTSEISSTDVDEQARAVLEEGKLQDGTPISDDKESAIKEMIDHGVRARSMARQLNELASKAEEIVEEDKEHLINEITTESFQMNYRHIMENAGLEDAAVSFESKNKLTELNYLSNEARKMAAVCSGLEDRILDFSPEGRIMSFLRADNKVMSTSLGDIKKYGNAIIRSGKLSDVSNIQIEWSLLSDFKEWIVYRNGKAVTDFTQEVIDDCELIMKSFRTIQNNDKIIRQMVGDIRQGKEPNKNIFSGIKQPEIIGKHILGDKFIKPSSGDFFRLFGWTPANPPLWLVGLTALFAGPLAPFVVVASQKILNKKHLEEAGTKIDGNKMKKMIEAIEEVYEVLDRDSHTEFDLKSIKTELSGDARRVAMEAAKQSKRTQMVLYEHAFFLTRSTAEVMRGLHGSWEIFLGQMQA